MKRTASLLGLMMLLSVGAFGDDGENSVVLRFKTAFGVRGPYLSSFSPPTPLRNLNGAPGPWSIEKVSGQLRRDGSLILHVRGLIIPALGQNPIPSFRAVVSCQSIDGSGNANVVNVASDAVPAPPSGNADFNQTLLLPDPCVAPIVFVTSPGLIWLAATGF
ncbi:MAG: hypothetical protein L0Z53_24675 [Acidobacteriales bacterium]|nr:hypothetical protein [Terriglobales bacterium]